MDTHPIFLFETASNALVEAVLYPTLGAGQIRAAEASWAAHRASLHAEHSHWD